MSTNQAGTGMTTEVERLQTVTLDDQRVLPYAEYGSKEGTPIVFFHGTPGSHVLGRLLHEDAKRADARILVIDRPDTVNRPPIPNEP